MLEFLVFVSPILPVAASVPCTLLFFLFAFGTAYYTYLACITDPIDVYLMKHIRETANSSSAFPEEDHQTCRSKLCYRGPDLSRLQQQEGSPETEETKYCWVCETSVAEHSMHCKFCNKCVSHFDHHCLWLNTCIGEANYGYFYRILWSTCGMLVVHTSCMLGIVIDMFLGGSSQARANAWFNANMWGVVAGVNIFFLLSNVVSLSAVSQLLHFHISLQKKGLTTYQFIVSDNARRREAFQKKEDRRAKRVAAVSKARREGKQFLGLRLQVGEYCCTPCDALPPEDEEAAAAADANGENGNETTSAGYAALGEGEDSTEEKETSMTSSERDLTHTHVMSLGESSSSQQGPKQQDDDDDVLPAPSMTSETDLDDDGNNDETGNESLSSPLEGGHEEVTAKDGLSAEKSKQQDESNGVNVEAAKATAKVTDATVEKPTKDSSGATTEEVTQGTVESNAKDAIAVQEDRPRALPKNERASPENI